jgi:lactose/raffinose/galactose permease
MFTFANSDLLEKFDVEVKPGAKVSHTDVAVKIEK